MFMQRKQGLKGDHSILQDVAVNHCRVLKPRESCEPQHTLICFVNLLLFQGHVCSPQSISLPTRHSFDRDHSILQDVAVNHCRVLKPRASCEPQHTLICFVTLLRRISFPRTCVLSAIDVHAKKAGFERRSQHPAGCSGKPLQSAETARILRTTAHLDMFCESVAFPRTCVLSAINLLAYTALFRSRSQHPAGCSGKPLQSAETARLL